MNPKLVRELYVHCQDDRILYLNPQPPDWITINKKYQRIFDRFDGTHTVDAIQAFIHAKYADESTVLVPQIKTLIRDSKLFEHNFGQSGGARTKTDNTVCTPRYIYLTLTERCNLKCRYCYATERRQPADVGLDTWSRYVRDILSASEKPMFIFTGGEPLLVPYVYELASLIQESGCESILLTNGTQITEQETAKQVAGLFSLTKISLDSLDEQVSSKLRGPGLVAVVEEAFDLLRSAGANVQILATVTLETREALDEFSDHFKGQVNFQPFYSMGRGRNGSALALTGKEYYAALTKTDVFRLLPGFSRNIHSYKNNPTKRCAMAREEISIDAAGNVFPCHMLHYDELNCGNLNERSLRTILCESAVLKELRELDVDRIDQCQECVFRNICGGACRARADIRKNGVDGANEFCDFEKQAILDALVYSYG